MLIITAPNDVYKVFLAGGITNCPNWQETFCNWAEEQTGFNAVIYNPRRYFFDVKDKLAEREQIEWEAKHLESADLVAFWFPKESICPITLLEYGKALGEGKHIIAGADPEYARFRDLQLQAEFKKKRPFYLHSKLLDVFNHLLVWLSSDEESPDDLIELGCCGEEKNAKEEEAQTATE